MGKKAFSVFIKPVAVIFLLLSIGCFAFAGWLDAHGINHLVLFFANLLLALITLVACNIHYGSLKNSNPHAFVRGVTLASFMKLMVIAVSVFVYLLAAGENRSVYAVVVAMLFYIIYSIFEVKGAMKLNKERNAEN